MQPVLVIHGGAGRRKVSGDELADLRESLRVILESSYKILKRGGSALAAVTEAVRLLEDDPRYNAGLGSKIQSDGHIRMSASVMDGERRRFGGCVNVERVKNPVLLAKALMNQEDRVLSGLGGERYAKQIGLPFASPFTAKQRELFRKKMTGKSGTVGAVALDVKGRLAAATSTGGRGFEFPYRVSDSPTVAGNFATKRGAVSATGTGEEIVESATAAAICSLLDAGWDLNKAVNRVLKNARAQGGNFGVIALDHKGRFVARTNTPFLTWGAMGADGLEMM